MRKIFVYLLLIVMLATIFTGCGDKPAVIDKPETITRGVVRDGLYINNDLRFSIEIPDDYHIASDEELDEKFDIKNIAEDFESNVYYLAFFSLKPIDDAEYNSHIMISVEDAAKYGYTDKDSYIDYMAYEKSTIYKDIEGADVKVTPRSNIWLGTRKFANRTITLSIGELYVVFDMYTVVQNGYFISVMIGAYSDSDLEFLRNYVDTLSLE